MREGEEDTMENWDDEKLAEVVAKKHGNEVGSQGMPKTDIVSLTLIDCQDP